MSDITLFDLEFLNKPQTIISPNVSKIRYVLNLKQVPFDVKWVNLGNMCEILPNVTKKEDKRPRVPVIIHGDKVVIDSWQIALYLEENFPHTSIFNGNIGVHKFFQNYVDQKIMPMIFKCVCIDMCKSAGPLECQQRFRQLKESDIGGKTLEDFHGDPKSNKAALKQVLVPIHQSLEQFPFITGEQPGWADIVLGSAFTLMFGLRPDLFQDFVLNAFEDDLFQTWWNNMEAYK